MAGQGLSNKEEILSDLAAASTPIAFFYGASDTQKRQKNTQQQFDTFLAALQPPRQLVSDHLFLYCASTNIYLGRAIALQ